MPWQSPTATPRAVPVPPKALVAVPKPDVVVPPKGEDVVVVAAPNAGLFAEPNNPPPVLLVPKGEDVVVFVEPKPPNPPPVFVAVFEPNSPVPVEVDVPKVGFAPKADDCCVPKAPIERFVSKLFGFFLIL